MKIYARISDNEKHISQVFENCDDVVKKKFPVGTQKQTELYLVYVEMLVNRDIIETQVLKNLMLNVRMAPPKDTELVKDIFTTLKDGGLPIADIKESDDFTEIFDAILSGDTVLFVDYAQKALIIATKGWPNRGVPEADTEVVVQGSKEAFNEVMRFSSALIRRRIRDTNLKIEQLKVGRRSKTDIGLMYLKDVCRPKILEETKKRIKNIDIDAVMDCGYIEQLIEDDWASPFPQIQITERPDKAASAILEGRIVVIVDNSPFVLIIPATLNVFFQASEDYYGRFQIMSMVRLLRFFAGIFALTLPALYISMAVFHPSMLPTLLTFKLAAARETVPFPAVVEIILMDLAFELLREAGIRLPGPVGNTIGIVGGIIIGQAAVEAGLVSPIVVIIVALTGISSFAIPSAQVVNGYKITKYLLIITSAIAGFFGFWIGLLVILIHLVSLKSFGIPYMYPFTSGEMNDYNDFKDTFFRFPLFTMDKRPIFANPETATRLNKDKIGNKHKKE